MAVRSAGLCIALRAVVMCLLGHVAVVSVLKLLHRSQIKHIFILSVLLALLKYNETKMIVFSDQNTTIYEA